MKKSKNKGLYQDKEGGLWVVIHLDDGDELELGKDISSCYGLYQYTLITSGDSDFLNIEYKDTMRKVNNVDYACIRLSHDSTDYAYVDEKFVKEEIMDRLNDIEDFHELQYFNSRYSDLITALKDKNGK